MQLELPDDEEEEEIEEEGGCDYNILIFEDDNIPTNDWKNFYSKQDVEKVKPKYRPIPEPKPEVKPQIYVEESLTEDDDIAPSEITEKSTTEPLSTSPELQSELETDRPELAEDEKSNW